MKKNKIKNLLIALFIGTTVISTSLCIFFSLKKNQNFVGYVKEADLLKKAHNEDLKILNKSIENLKNARIIDTNKKMYKIAESIVDSNSLKSGLNFELPKLSKNSEYIISAEAINPWNVHNEKAYKSSIKVSIVIKTKLDSKELVSKPVFFQVKYLKDDEITDFLKLFKNQESPQVLEEVSFYLTHNPVINTNNKDEVKTSESIELHDISPLISKIYNLPSNPKKIKYQITYKRRDEDVPQKIYYDVHSALSNSVLESEFNSQEFWVTYSSEAK